MTGCCDFAVLGSGFAGSITAAILTRLGHGVVLVDRGHHPRFAIGESSTPIANLILRTFAERYDLPLLDALSRWGSWTEAHPEIRRGLKRGFSYFHHSIGAPFQGRADGSDRLLVAASSADAVGDTHWLRADVDHALLRMAAAVGVDVHEDAPVSALRRDTGGWDITVGHGDAERTLRARFVVDATGSGGVLPRHLELAPVVTRTRSRALFGHVADLRPWEVVLVERGVSVAGHPFPADRAALHHVFDHGWMWQLRFDDGITSVGWVLDARHYGAGSRHPAVEWQTLVQRLPTVAAQCADITWVDPPGGLQATGLLQRRWSAVCGDGWLLLPHTAGFVDPLHSTGIAQSLSGVERFVGCVERQWRRPGWSPALAAYGRSLEAEFELIDRLVAGCYALTHRFAAFAAYCMVYFAAATSDEIVRSESGAPPAGGFLMSSDERFRAVADGLYRIATHPQLTGLSDAAFAERVRAALAPFNRVGLCNPALRNMYRYTAHA